MCTCVPLCVCVHTLCVWGYGVYMCEAILCPNNPKHLGHTCAGWMQQHTTRTLLHTHIALQTLQAPHTAAQTRVQYYTQQAAKLMT